MDLDKVRALSDKDLRSLLRLISATVVDDYQVAANRGEFTPELEVFIAEMHELIETSIDAALDNFFSGKQNEGKSN